MEERLGLRLAPALLAPAKVSRQFAGSRVERQVLTQVFDMIWQSAQGQRESAVDGLGSVAPTSSGVVQESVASTGGDTSRAGWQKGGIA